MNSTYEEKLEKYGSLTFANVGYQHNAFLRQNKDLFVTEKNTGKP